MSVLYMHQIIERDPNPLAIPPRPAPVAPAVEFSELPNRLWTYRVAAGAVTLGYVRHALDGWWVARTFGSDTEAAEIKRFKARDKAVEWLQQHCGGK